MTQSALQPQVLPEKFVYLEHIDPSILQEVRYAMHHNFVGRPIPSYEAPCIIVTEPVALGLKAVQEELKAFNMTLKVYDGYRPQDAVDAFVKWGDDFQDQAMKAEFYPALDKKEVFNGYIAKKILSHPWGSGRPHDRALACSGSALLETRGSCT